MPQRFFRFWRRLNWSVPFHFSAKLVQLGSSWGPVFIIHFLPPLGPNWYTNSRNWYTSKDTNGPASSRASDPSARNSRKANHRRHRPTSRCRTVDCDTIARHRAGKGASVRLRHAERSCNSASSSRPRSGTQQPWEPHTRISANWAQPLQLRDHRRLPEQATPQRVHTGSRSVCTRR